MVWICAGDHDLNFARSFKGSTSLSEPIDGSGEDVFPTGGRDGAVVSSGMTGNVEAVRRVPLGLREYDILYPSFATVA